MRGMEREKAGQGRDLCLSSTLLSLIFFEPLTKVYVSRGGPTSIVQTFCKNILTWQMPLENLQ